jgi:2-polyprenyl-6-methoxyphenol hydroxylase-like FAD-dependent oxidoreductase
MPSSTPHDVAVLVVGAGPVGLTMACELTRHGLGCRIIDRNEAPTTQSRALALHARTLEVFENVGIIEPVLARGRPIHGLNVSTHGRRIIHLRFDLRDLATPYPYVVSLPQNDTEQILTDLLTRRGVTIERHTELVDLRQESSGVVATLCASEGTREVRAKWLIGCDGARSVVRHRLDQPFEGAEYEETFLLADVHIDWTPPEDEGCVLLQNDGGAFAAFPLPGPRRWRLIDTSAVDVGDDPGRIIERFREILAANGHREAVIRDTVWTSSFRIHRRVVRHFRVGRCFLAGDAAHIHSPVGGQGMNTGMQDAYNLAWKLALVEAGAGREAILDSFNAERRPVALDVLRGTDFATRIVQLHHPMLGGARNFIAELLCHLDFVQHQVSRNLSELGVDYRHSPIVAEDHAGLIRTLITNPGRLGDYFDFTHGPHAGDRVPDVALQPADAAGPTRLFDAVRGIRHTLLLFPGLHPETSASGLGAVHALVRERYGATISPLFVRRGNHTLSPANADHLLDPSDHLHRRFGAHSECLYLIRPDGYVGYRSQPPDAGRLRAFLERIFV